MRTTKIYIKNLFGIAEKELDGSCIEITGKNGVGKTSVIDAIRYALTNDSERDYIVRNGETEGEILIETDTGLSINRKKRINQSDYKSIKEDGKACAKPEAFLNKIFTPIQLNPIAFTQMSKQEQNREIIDLIEFNWDLNWIRDKFGEIPTGIDYTQNILQVLNQIQSEGGMYFKERQDVNRDIRNKLSFIEDIAKDIPESYNAERWKNYDLGQQYKKLSEIKENNSKIQRARGFKDSYNNKVRGYEAEKEIAVSIAERSISIEREGILSSIERLKAEIIAAEDKLNGLNSRLEDKIHILQSEYETKIARLDGDIKIADEWSNKPTVETIEIEREIKTAETMIKHLNEYNRLVVMENDIKGLRSKSEKLTDKIELARTLPGQILKEAVIPIEGLEVKDGVPLINGLPVSNLSEGEKLDLCVDVAISKPNLLQIILIDGSEKLSEENRTRIYSKCKAKGLQFIATRTTNDNELEVIAL